MSNTRPATELDFDKIKADLITFIKSNETYTDYNFEGSALNTIIDVLAYNTHNNAYYANMLHNESFLDTAQKRASVVSRAKEMGYTPRSSVCSNAFVNISFGLNQSNEQYNSISLDKGAAFTSYNDNGSYTFVTPQSYTSIKTGSAHVFQNVRIVAGTLVNNTFRVDTTRNTRSIFTIPNKNIDTSTLQVYVKSSESALTSVEYFRVDDVYSLTSNSRSYFLQESYDGFFQIYFGDNVLGIQPVDGNIIAVDYVICSDYALPNLCKTFRFVDNTSTITDATVTTVQVAYGGAEKENLESIKTNAIKSNSAKERTVTKSDYELLLMEKFNFIKSVSVWGGEENNPPIYGKVFISAQPISGYVITDLVKNDVLYPVVKNNSVVSVSPVFVDPDYVYVDFITYIKFNKNKTNLTRNSVEILVKNKISDYVEFTSKFNGDYLESALVNEILNLDDGIVSVDIDKRVGFKITPLEGVNTTLNKTLNNQIVAGSLSSSTFNVLGIGGIVAAQIKEKTFSSEIGELGVYSLDGKLIATIGSINYATGNINISFTVDSYTSISRYINIRVDLFNDDIRTFRNQIIVMDDAKVDLPANINSNNIVITELYDK